MMKKMYFYYPSKIHFAHQHMMKLVPEEFSVDYKAMAGNPVMEAVTSKPSLKQKIANLAEPAISWTYNNMKIMGGSPKKRKFMGAGYDLIHSAQALLETDTPYVVDFEHASVFSGYNQYAFRYKPFVQALEKGLKDNHLKKLMAWSNHAKKSMSNFVKTDKVETVYPCAKFENVPKKKNSEKVNFLFIGRTFYEKGAYESLLAFEKICEKYDATFTVVANLPPEAEKFSKNKKITLLGLQPYEKIRELYQNSDVFMFPTHYDTFGFVIPEAFSFGLPVIGVDSFSSPELIEHEKTGLIIKSYFSCFSEDCGYAWPTIDATARARIKLSKNPPSWYIDNLALAMEQMINDGALRSRLSRNAYEITTGGKFSEKAYRAKMDKIYREALE